MVQTIPPLTRQTAMQTVNNSEELDKFKPLGYFYADEDEIGQCLFIMNHTNIRRCPHT
jgi:hypothetical protein